MNTLSHTRLAPPLSEILQAGTLCTFRTLKTVFFANVGRLSTSLDPMYIRTTEFFAPLFGSIIVNNFMISLRRAMYSQQHIFCVALIKLCSKRGQGFVLGHSFSLCLFLRRKLCRNRYYVPSIGNRRKCAKVFYCGSSNATLIIQIGQRPSVRFAQNRVGFSCANLQIIRKGTYFKILDRKWVLQMSILLYGFAASHRVQGTLS